MISWGRSWLASLVYYRPSILLNFISVQRPERPHTWDEDLRMEFFDMLYPRSRSHVTRICLVYTFASPLPCPFRQLYCLHSHNTCRASQNGVHIRPSISGPSPFLVVDLDASGFVLPLVMLSIHNSAGQPSDRVKLFFAITTRPSHIITLL